MIDKLFGSKTRVKLLHLFLNNPSKSFYVREITRTIDEQINSVRRELSNMLTVGVINSETHDNKLYYEVDQRYEHYVALRSIFGDSDVAKSIKPSARGRSSDWITIVNNIPGARVVIAAGVLVEESHTKIDLLLAGDISQQRLKKAVNAVEKLEGRELNYSVMRYEEFYYRMSIRDRFITEILNGAHVVVTDADNVLKG